MKSKLLTLAVMAAICGPVAAQSVDPKCVASVANPSVTDDWNRCTATGDGASADALGTATGIDSSAGYEGTATGINSEAGYGGTATGAGSSASTMATATGYGANASGDYSIATGPNSQASEVGSIAVGTQANASGHNSIATGTQAQASAQGAAAYGMNSNAEGAFSFAALGAAQGNYSVAIGAASIAGGSGSLGMAGGHAFADNSIAIGNLSRVDSTSPGGIALNGTVINGRGLAIHGSSNGDVATAIQGSANGNRAIAIHGQAGNPGDPSASTGDIALGGNALGGARSATQVGFTGSALASGATAVGAAAQANQINSTAVGAGSRANAEGAVALGVNSEANEANTVSVGNGFNLKRRITSVAAGTGDNDAVIVEQLAPFAASLGGGSNFNGGIFTPPSFVLSMGTYNNVNDALYALDNKPGGGGQGPAGANGASAYQVATNNGFVGTEQEWLASLKGDTGATGAAGSAGAQGERGETGLAGRDGLDGRDGIDGQNAEGGSGTAGPQGPAGERGETGLAGSDGIDGERGETGLTGDAGDSAYEVAVSEGFQGNQAEWLESLKGRDGRDGIGSEILGGDNIEVTKNEDGTQTVALADDVKLSDQGSLQVGSTTVNAMGVTVQGGPSMTQKGIDAGNQRITSVAPGRIEQGSTDAVNGGQIWELDDRWNDRFERNDKRIDGLGAQLGAMTQMVGAAAAGGGGRIGEVQLNAGIGFSGNQAALAIGWSTRVSPRISLSGGVSFGTGNKPVAGMGISINLGR